MELSDVSHPALDAGSISSLVYHDQYDYPMTLEELTRWQCTTCHSRPDRESSLDPRLRGDDDMFGFKDGYYFLAGREKIVAVRQKRAKASEKKLQILKKYLPVFQRMPGILFVGVTGSLAMGNASEGSDIDLMVITKNNSLWLTRLITLIILIILRVPLRRAGNKQEKDKLCLNLWLDEIAISWPVDDRSAFTAHEIAQVIPVVNKQHIYERFTDGNLWIKDWWPNALVTPVSSIVIPAKAGIHTNILFKILNFCAYRAQLWYMKSKITTEVVSPHRALFHPRVQSKVIFVP